MALSPEQISQINRQNASHSTGAKTEEGRRRSSANSCKHGMTAQKLVLANEPKDWILDLTARWLDHYQPQSPGRQALVDRAVMATVHHERSKTYLTGALGEQVRTAQRNYDQQQQDVVLHYVDLLTTDPATAVRRLKQSAAGCRWLICELQKFQGEWIDAGVSGVAAAPGRLAGSLGCRLDDPLDAEAYTLWYYNTAAHAPRTEWAVAHLADRSRMPDTLWKSFHPEGAPTPEAAQDELGLILKKPLDALKRLESQLKTEVEEPARAAAMEKAMLLAPAELALWLRYERMHDAMFHRSYGALERKEAPRPEPEAGPVPSAEPDLGPKDEEAAPPPGEIEVLVEEAAAASAAGNIPAAEGPDTAVEADVERQTKRVVTVAPEAPDGGAAAMPAVDLPRAEEAGASEATSTLAAEGPVGAVETDVERQTKRVVTVAPEVMPAEVLAREKPAASRPGRIEDPAPPATLEDAARTSTAGSGDWAEGAEGHPGIVVPAAHAGDAPRRLPGDGGGGSANRPAPEPGAGLPRAGPGAEGVLAVLPVAVGTGG